MSRQNEVVFTICGDVIVLSAVYFISWKASAIDASIVSWHALIANCIFVVFWLFLFQTFDLYESRSKIQIINELFKLFRVIVVGMLIIFGLAYLVDIDFMKARGFIPAYLVMLPSILIWRFFWRGLIGEHVRSRPEKVLIFQNGDSIDNYSCFNVIKRVKLNKVNPVVPEAVLTNDDVEGIIIESNGSDKKNILNVISRLAATKYEIFISPKLYPVVYQYFLVQKIPDSPFLKIIFHPLSSWDQFLKRIVDISISLLALFILAPILVLIALLIKIDSEGPVLYRQKRLGLRGKEFILYKFRSMISDAEKHTGPVWAEKNDRRITRMGQTIRPLRLDEVPQLINVLKGDMSFVGPRPERPAFLKQLKEAIPLYTLRLTVHPGITGLAQVKHAYDVSVEHVKRKLEYDLQYINNMSLRLDVKIFLKTVLTVLKKEGAH
jgi:exopolysaccharide biosynthesis polyprenyl glycosylphosphotransferase